MCERYGATVTRLDVEWGRACDPDALRAQLKATPRRHRRDGPRGNVHRRGEPGARAGGDRARARRADHRRCRHLARRHAARRRRLGHRRRLQLHAEVPRRAVGPGAGRLRPARARAARRSAAASTSTCSCSRTTGCAASITTRCRRRWSTRSTKRCRSSRRKGSRRAGRGTSAIIARCSRRSRRSGSRCCRREGERLWTLNAVRVPDGVDEAAVRMHLLEQFNIEIGAGLGPLAGKIWRVGLMGASSSPRLIVLLLGALESALAKQSADARRADRCCRSPSDGPARARRPLASRRSLAVPALGVRAALTYAVPHAARRPPAADDPIRRRRRSWSCASAKRARDGKTPRRVQRWVELRTHLAGSEARGAGRRRRRVLAARRRRFRTAAGIDRDRLGARPLGRAAAARSRSSWPRTSICRRRGIRCASCASWSSRGGSRRS